MKDFAIAVGTMVLGSLIAAFLWSKYQNHKQEKTA